MMTRIVQSLHFSRKIIRHEANKPKVIEKLRKLDARIGIIDEDPDSEQPSDMKNYQEIERVGDIIIFERKDNTKKHLFVICPRMEDWLLKRAAGNNISLRNFNLKNDPNEIHEINIERNVNYRNFINKVIEVDDEIDTLRARIAKIFKEGN